MPVCKDRSFKSAINFLKSFYIIGHDSKGSWRCTCPQFAKTMQCKHALGAAISYKTVDVPDEYNIAIIGANKRKPGRPRKRSCYSKD